MHHQKKDEYSFTHSSGDLCFAVRFVEENGIVCVSEEIRRDRVRHGRQ